MQGSLWSRLKLTWVARILLGGIFVYSGAVKLLQPLEFAGNIAAYQLLPHFANVFFAATLPWVECFCGLMLIVGWRTRPAAFMLVGMMVVFLIALSSAMVKGLVIDCGCFQVGVSEDPPPLWISLIRDLGLLLLSLMVWIDACRSRGSAVPA